MTRNQKYYRRGKIRSRNEAIEFQYRFSEFSDNPIDMMDLYDWQDYFRRIGKRFGMLREFTENGII